jgi:hypothetical protein
MPRAPVDKAAYESAVGHKLTDAEYEKLRAAPGAQTRPGQVVAPPAPPPKPKPPAPVTALTPGEEQAFQAWVSKNHVPFDPGPSADYDMRGFYKALEAKDPRATTAVNPADKEMHFPDTWKTPYHETFSNESVYAPADAPHWDGYLLIDKNGYVLADETPPGEQSKAGKRGPSTK